MPTLAGAESRRTMDLAELEEAAEEAPVVKLVNLILTDAMKRGACDIHIEPYEKEFRVRFRIDGILYEIMNPPLKLKDAITSRLKIMAKLDISREAAAAGRPHQDQDEARRKNKEMDFRVSVLPDAVRREDRACGCSTRRTCMLDMTSWASSRSR